MSMLVHSLIDKFDLGEPQPAPRAALPQPKSVTLDPGLKQLLGVDKFPLGEQAFIETVRLRQEIEKSKQEETRRQIADKNLEMIKLAILANVPPHLIPVMCVNPGDYNSSLYQLVPLPPPQLAMVPPQPPPPPPPPMYYPPPAMHQSPVKRPGEPITDPLNASPTLPVHYRFGDNTTSPPKRPPLTPQHHLRPRKQPTHQRTTLVPDRIALMLPLTTNTLQVRALPAQPPAKNRPPPTQESMTLFQHIIQFHHWQPGESPQQQPSAGPQPRPESDKSSYEYGGAPALTPKPPSHKRFKLEVEATDDDDTIDDTTEMSPQQAPPTDIGHGTIS